VVSPVVMAGRLSTKAWLVVYNNNNNNKIERLVEIMRR